MRLYQDQPYLDRFESQVLRAWSEGNQHFAVLQQTLFYPSAGGQPHDTGTLDGVQVLDVFEDGKATGQVVHVLAAPLTSTKVEGVLDWPRRYRHMQRHTAQHLLSQAFLRAANWETVAVGLAGPVCTIDFAAPPNDEVLRQAEALAAWAVYAHLPIRSFWINQEQLALYPLRRPPKVSGDIRLVEIENWDLSACGGTHLRSSSEAGPIKILKAERYKNGTRIYFCAGWEALEDYRQKHSLLQRLAESFSTQPLEIEKPLAKQADELYRVKGENIELRSHLAERITQELLTQFPGLTIAAKVPAAVIAEVGAKLAEWPGVLALLAAPQGDQVRLLLAKHPSRPENLQALWQERLKPLGAKGGGKEVLNGLLPAEALVQALKGWS